MLKRIVLSVCAAVAAAVVAQAETYTWNAGSGTWSTPENWLPNGTPGVGDDVVLPAPTDAANSYVVTADAAINVKSLTVGTDSDTITNGCTATFESQTAEMHQVAENVVVKKGGVLTHTFIPKTGLTAPYYKVNFSVGGDVLIDAYGKVDVNNKSGLGISPGAGAWGAGASHGGYGAPSSKTPPLAPCYGSIREPSDPGSYGSGGGGNGGGVVRFDVAGTFTLNGSIQAKATRTTVNYGNGSGGSVWLTVGTLAGTGTVSVVASDDQRYGGGGRVAVKETTATDFASFTGTISCDNGTLYQEHKGDVEGRGELILQQGKYGRGREFSNRVAGADDPFGRITFVGEGSVVSVLDGIVIKSYGDVAAAGNSICATAGTFGGIDICGAATGTTKVSGTFEVGAFFCTNGADTIEFDAGTAVSVFDNGMLFISGAEAKPLTMMSAEPSWNLVLGNDVDAQVKYVAVSNGVAFSTITDFGGTDLGGNVKWTFPAMPRIDDPIIWKGTAGSSWLLAENWVDKDGGNRLPIETDCVVISNGCPAYPTLSLASVAFHQLRIGPGAELTIANTQVSVVGDLVCDGKIVLSETASLSAAGDVTLAADSLTAGAESVFALAGEGEQTADLGGNAFNRLEVLGPSVTFTNGFSTTFFRCEQPREVTLRFSAGDTYAASDLRMLPGAGGSLTLRSTQEGESWFLNAGAGAVCDGVSVADCDARVGCAICVTSNTDITRTYNWRTGATEWTGAAGTNWDDPENWSGGVPTSESDVRIFPAANAPKLSSATSIRSLVVGNGSGEFTLVLSGALAVSDFLRVNDGATVVVDAPLSVTNDVYLASGAELTHSAGTDAKPYKLNLYCGRDMVVEAGAVITADNLGGSTKGAGTGGWGAGGSYGGRGNFGQNGGNPCYGSIREPNDLGSTGQTGNGGGVIRLEVVGTLRVDGTISSDGTQGNSTNHGTGSGGSVWLTVGTLTGGGEIHAIATGKSGYTQLGGGGRIAIKQTTASDRTAFTGPISVSNGTLYREDAGDESGRGELIFQGGKDQISELSAAVVDATNGFKKITFTGTGMTLIVMDDICVPVYGDFAAAGNTIKSDVTAIIDPKTRTPTTTKGGVMGGFDIIGASGQVTHVSGTYTVGKLICTNAASAIEFAAGTTITLRDSALLRLLGTEQSQLVMTSPEPSWNLVLGDNVDAMVKYVAASNGVASSTIADFDGTDLGGNENWTFPVLPKLGDPIVWRGTAGSSWSVAENWVDKDGGNRLPLETDCVVISNGCPAYPTLSVASAAYHQLLIGPGAELTIVDTPITIASDLVCEGKLVLSGTTVLSAAGDVTLAAGSLTAGAESVFALVGEDEQSADLGGNAFNRLVVAGPSVTFAHGFSTTFFRCEQPRAVELRFSKGDTYAASDLRMLPGAGGSLTLRSTQEGESWYLNAGAGAVCDGVSVADCDARVGCAICVTSYNDLGRNHNWRSGTTAWTGTKGTAWDDPENWSDGVPTPTSDVRIFPTDNAPKLSSATGIRSLVVGDGSGAVTLSGALAVSDFLRVNDGATMVIDKPLSVTNDVYLASGATLTHTAGTDTNLNKLNLYCGRDMVMEEGAVITADNLGGSKKGRANGAWGSGGSYGGRGSNPGRGSPCYGSIREPNDLGSTGAIGNGGGAIRLEVVRTLRMDGTISADATMTKTGYYGTGSGGSVWLTVGTLVGKGPISVITMNSTQLGGGGRVAIRQTVASTRTDFTGTISVSNGTLYREDAGDEPGRGELIFQGGTGRISELSEAVVDATNGFKKITFTGTGMTLIVMDDVRVPVYGDVVAAENTIKSGVTSIMDPNDNQNDNNTTTGGILGGFDVLGPVDDTTHLSGAFRLGTFICTNGAEALEFAAGTTMTNYSNGTLWLTGTDQRKTVLKSSETGSPWFISVGTNVVGKVRCLDVYDSDASGGQTIKAKRSTGRKGRNNVNWEFPAGFVLVVR